MRTHLKNSSSESGQLMVESIIAISVLIIGLLGIFTLLSRSLSLNRVIADQSAATHLAAEGIELVKNLIDANAIQRRPWNLGVNPGDYEVDFNDGALAVPQNRKLDFDSGSGQYSYDSGSPTTFQRLIVISQPSPDELKVNSLVKWTTRGGGQFEVNLEDHFFNWR
ncbi:MAG: hypothetical protein HYY86_02460 [Candidatus Harrisonbacteria bacterium]|nr:hypothetical protein [Candidatus Harrisonbacteria bacterium]